MTTAISLLILALQLLTAVSNNPNLPASFRQTAISVAQEAIQQANAAQSTVVPVVIQPQDYATIQGQPTPTTPNAPVLYGSVTATQPMPTDKSDIVMTIEDQRQTIDGPLTMIKIIVNDENGKPINNIPISLTYNGKTTDAKIDTTYGQDPTPYHQFSIFQADNVNTFTIKANGMEKSFTF